MKKILSLVAIATLMMSCGSKKDSDNTPKDFKINVISVKDGTVKLECTEGCAWEDLSWTRSNMQPQAINAYGMINNIDERVDENDRLPRFLFTIEPTDNGAILESIRGTSWDKLSFACLNDCNQMIDYEGLVSEK